MFYLIGLGLGDVKDITVKGLEIVKNSKRVYLEAYTSILTVGKEQLEEFYGREIVLADRDTTELNSDVLLDGADVDDVAFLVVGDPLGATTHSDLILRAVQKGIRYQIIHNASIVNAVGCCGLQLYNFDIKMKEQSLENLMRKQNIYEPPRFMSVSQAAQQLIKIIQRRKGEGTESTALLPSTVCVAMARVGADDQKIVVANLRQLTSIDMGTPLHSLVIPGNMHPIELDMLKLFAMDHSIKEQLSVLASASCSH
ncbi:hypothetical protein C0Q70_16672 [Pomacea canaliculata]|uniref:diphthine methyl ester synthase n=1 Tax=Pomacea canaliculata TaxID=400727 RepID=A0A2T7NQI1_POMCA|nr:hypothetical protein C0Q70_16672 [Pomacea canaliculata]